jgi:ATP-binding cassette, subfamily C (CFTR/MRP), member 1
MDRGCITEHGTYPKLMAKNKEFARLYREFGGQKEQNHGGISEDPEPSQPRMDIGMNIDAFENQAMIEKSIGKGRLEGRLIIAEKRTTGSISYGGMFRSRIIFFF